MRYLFFESVQSLYSHVLVTSHYRQTPQPFFLCCFGSTDASVFQVFGITSHRSRRFCSSSPRNNDFCVLCFSHYFQFERRPRSPFNSNSRFRCVFTSLLPFHSQVNQTCEAPIHLLQNMKLEIKNILHPRHVPSQF